MILDTKLLKFVNQLIFYADDVVLIKRFCSDETLQVSGSHQKKRTASDLPSENRFHLIGYSSGGQR